MAQILVATYSFTDTVVSITGPGGTFQIGGPDTAAAEEGISINWGEENTTMNIGADGGVMHSMHAARAGNAMVRLQKTSPVNFLLSNLWNYQRQSSIYWGQNIITLRQVALGDLYNIAACAFIRFPNNSYGKIGGTIEWEWLCGSIDPLLGPGVSYLTS
jgi:hypothetical protein